MQNVGCGAESRVALNIHTVTLNIHAFALDIHTVALNIPAAAAELVVGALRYTITSPELAGLERDTRNTDVRGWRVTAGEHPGGSAVSQAARPKQGAPPCL
eukprot:5589951-Pyramimonas_sp.AAC.1